MIIIIVMDQSRHFKGVKAESTCVYNHLPDTKGVARSERNNIISGVIVLCFLFASVSIKIRLKLIVKKIHKFLTLYELKYDCH